MPEVAGPAADAGAAPSVSSGGAARAAAGVGADASVAAPVGDRATSSSHATGLVVSVGVGAGPAAYSETLSA